jgi:hypothetical protein
MIGEADVRFSVMDSFLVQLQWVAHVENFAGIDVAKTRGKELA